MEKKGNIGVTTENIFPVIKQFLYSDHEIFLREMVSNAVDATQKMKTLASAGSLGKELYAALADLVKEYDYPVCFNFPVGHVTHNLPLINGAKVELVVGITPAQANPPCSS